MKVILLEELKGRGGEGDVIEVATGYAVNYLFPKKIAILATKGNLKQLELRRHNIAKREADRIDSADKLMAALEGKIIRIGAKVGEEGQLFGSVTTTQIAEAVAEKFKIEVDRRKVDIHGLIKAAGQHEVTVNVYRDLKATMIVDVVDENAVEDTTAKSDDTTTESVQAGETDGIETAPQAEAEAAAAPAETEDAVGANEVKEHEVLSKEEEPNE